MPARGWLLLRSPRHVSSRCCAGGEEEVRAGSVRSSSSRHHFPASRQAQDLRQSEQVDLRVEWCGHEGTATGVSPARCKIQDR
eukprot:763295-Hanusia_phi.AAC.3